VGSSGYHFDMAGDLKHEEQRPAGEGGGPLLTEATAVSEAIRSVADREAAELVAAATRDADRLRALASRQADEVRSAGAARAETLRAIAADDAEAMALAADRRAREAVLAARREGERLREDAHDRARHLGTTADRRAEEVLASAAAYAADLTASARVHAEELKTRAARDAADRLAQARSDLEEAVGARAAAVREAALRREAAARRAAEVTGEAGADLDLARRVRSRARRDAGAVLAQAMEQAAASLQAAAREFDAANELLAREERGPGRGATVAEPSSPPPVRTLTVGDLVPVPWAGAEPDVQAVAPAAASAPPAAPVAPPAAPVAPPAAPPLVPVLSFGRELVLRLLVLGGVGTTLWFWLWWLATGHGNWTFGSEAATALLAWVFGLSAYFFFFVCRMSRPNPRLPLPDLRVAMVVTKAPAEAWEVLERTLEAMLAQEYAGPYDVWLADERPTLETLQWCLAHDVKVSTRHGVDEYHRPTWPRRTRSKEGNLAWFYDQVGYERYDVVVQLDADHVPAPGYLEAMVRPFVDPAIGYVSAPSICDANLAEGWTVRGRLYREASMHGPVQAGCNGGYAPVCIGSHYAVRTAALRDVGGLGPELAEDYSTTLWLQSAGWDGVFNIDAVAHGDGPATLEEMLVQEVQWARSLGTILVRWAPARLRTVRWRARPRLAFALVYYPVAGLVVAMASAAPVVGVLLHTSWGNTSLAGFYIHLWPHTVVSMALVLYLRRCMLLRPVDGKVWSWELALFQLVRWPWTLWGFLQGIYAGRRSKVVNFRVTPKSVPGVRALPPRYVGPTLVLGSVPAWVVVLVRHPGPALGLMVLATTQALVYLGCASLVVALHLAGNRRRRRQAMALSTVAGPAPVSPGPAGWDAALLTLAVVVPTLAALLWRLWLVGLRA
jgi:cellulose synthase (UDP-forming)